MVYIVMRGEPSVYAYDGTVWWPDKAFDNQQSADNYINEQYRINGRESGFEYEIEIMEIRE